MKKIIALVFCILFLFTACSGENGKKTEINQDNYASYVGAGEMTLINILVNSNAKFVSEVFYGNHLAVDETKAIAKGGDTFAPVVSDEYKTLADLKLHMESTYTKEVIQSILGNPEKYVDIDGKLYFNMKYAETDYKTDWTSPVVSANIDADGKYIINITVKNEKGKDIEITASAVSENGSLKLENIYY
ncbi:MAG: hypothetical protein IKK63_03910 [Clostridia bacterium]|nr:hypothetical protein [Clostridia bacterium]MBR3819098.1 hypothetical protein [Clostridia bacterium]